MRLRDYAHTFGFTGELITKSSAFSTTFAALRSARTDFMAGEREGDPVEGTFHCEGRRYDDLRASRLAELSNSARIEIVQSLISLNSPCPWRLWRNAISKLRTLANPEIAAVIQFSYDAMNLYKSTLAVSRTGALA
jgi:hypothetical protein